jgi:sec-independent protein translocase protein TatC
LVYELWRFIAPALYVHERRSVSIAFWAGTLMFFLGCAVGYLLVFPLTFRFLAEYQLSATIANQISLNSYMSNFLGMVFVMGLVFELPLMTWLLSNLGVVNRAMLSAFRRYAVVGLLVLSAFITPSGDPFTLMVVFMPLYLLYEVGIVVAKR